MESKTELSKEDLELIEAAKEAVIAKAYRTTIFERFSCRRHAQRRQRQVKEFQPRKTCDKSSLPIAQKLA